MALHVREPFAYDDHRGVTRVFHPGQLVADDDPAIKGREHLFETADENVARLTPEGREEAQRRPIATVEDASSEPGSRRSRSTRGRGAKKATAKKAATEKAPEPKPEPTPEPSKDGNE